MQSELSTFYHRREMEELKLAELATADIPRNVHVRMAHYYARLARRSEDQAAAATPASH